MHLRMASGRRIAGVLVTLGAACAIAACRPSPTYDLSWTVQHSADTAGGTATIGLIVRQDRDGAPLSGAQLTLEGHMAHPGMAPAVTRMTEAAAGRYEARLRLTMAGEWTLVVSGTLADGQRVTWEHRVSVESAAPSA